MTDEGQSLSRRERRAREQREAARGMEDTAALAGTGTGDVPTLGPGGVPMSRRERRRLERLQRPLETWTAEEEMIATGQIPAMTPERLAEQDQLAQARAAQESEESPAQAEDLRAVVGDQAVEEDAGDAQPSGALAGEVTEWPIPDADGAPESTDAAQQDFSAAWAPAQDDPQWSPPQPQEDAEEEPVLPQRTSLLPGRTENDAAPESEGPTAAPGDSDVVGRDEPVQPEPTSEATADAELEAASEPEPEPAREDESLAGMPPGMTPEMFMALFPPGSLQRKLMEQQFAEQTGTDAPATDDEPAAVDAPEAELDSAEEIRRLTAEAMAGIEGASRAEDTQDTQHPADAHDAPEQSPWQALTPASETPAEWGAQDFGAPSAPSPAAETSGAQALEEQAQEHPFQAESAAPSFDALVTDEDAVEQPAPSWPPAQSPFPSVQEEPQTPQQHAAQPTAPPEPTSLWESHPLAAVEAPSQPIHEPDSEVENTQVPIPQPDLSQFRPATFGSPMTVDNMPPVEPVPTGQIEVPRRERPDLEPEEHGPRHFRWAHLAVFGAVAFVLGVVVWNVAGNG